jgi:4-amino-4-deoxy-L-arabinose transferase-like glycosyltransferase
MLSKLDRFDYGMLLILIVAFVVVGMLPFAPSKYGDLVFHNEAKALAMAIKGGGPWSNVAFTRAPAPVLYYAIPYLTIRSGSADHAYWLSGFIWTFLWMAISILLIRRAGALFGGSLVGKLAALLTLLSPFGVYYSYGILAESPAYIGVIFFIYGFARWQDRRDHSSLFSDKNWLIWTGLSLFILSRPNAILILGVALIAATVIRLGKSAHHRQEAKFILANVAVTSLIVIVAFSVVSALPGSWQSGNLAHVVFQGRFQYRTEPWDWREWSKANRQGSVDHASWVNELNELKRQSDETGTPISTLQRQWILKDIKEHPVLTLRLAAIRLVSLHVAVVNSQKPEAFRFGPFSGRILYASFHILVNSVTCLILLASGCFLFAKRERIISNWPLWSPWMALLIFHAFTYAEPRYMFPCYPGLVILAAWGLAPLLLRVNRHIAAVRSVSIRPQAQ